MNIIVIAKEPVAGRVKTRLVPPLTFQQAADVACAALQDTLVAAKSFDSRLIALDGTPGVWLPSGWRITPQPAGDQDVRLVSAFAAADPGPAILVGMDTPQVTEAQLHSFDSSEFDACLGLAEDGGYWAIGFADTSMAAQTITGVPMSTARTGATQLARLRAQGLRVQLLDVLSDVDTIDVARAVADGAPDTLFAQALRRCNRQAA